MARPGARSVRDALGRALFKAAWVFLVLPQETADLVKKLRHSTEEFDRFCTQHGRERLAVLFALRDGPDAHMKITLLDGKCNAQKIADIVMEAVPYILMCFSNMWSEDVRKMADVIRGWIHGLSPSPVAIPNLCHEMDACAIAIPNGPMAFMGFRPRPDRCHWLSPSLIVVQIYQSRRQHLLDKKQRLPSNWEPFKDTLLTGDGMAKECREAMLSNKNAPQLSEMTKVLKGVLQLINQVGDTSNIGRMVA